MSAIQTGDITRQSARYAGVWGTSIAVCSFVMGLLAELIRWAFDHTSNADLRAGAWLSVAMGILCFLFLFVSQWIGLASIQINRQKPNPSFPARSSLRLLCALSVLLAVVAFWGLTREHVSIGYRVLMLLWAAAILIGWPRTIHLNATSIWQRNRWGKKVSIPYSEIERVAPGYQMVLVIAKDGTTIRHTSLHADAEGFVSAIEDRSQERVTCGF